jgi:two-component system OmpR family response regulator
MRKRILVVDDEASFTAMLKCALEADGYYEVHEENDATRAVTAAREVDPDLIVLDVMMPDMDGSEVAALLREDRRFANTPIVFITALALESEAGGAAGGAMTRGGQTYLPKSTPVDKLLACIQQKLPARGVTVGV